MSSGPPGRRVSPRDIQVVQNLIERCLQLYMNQREVVQTLLAQAKIEPGFTELVWQKLEEENREFFNAYYLRLMVKQQISEFNKLLEQQVELMRQINPTGLPPLPTSNGSHVAPAQNSACYAPEHTGPALKSENLHQQIGSSLTNGFANGGSLLHPIMDPTISMSAHSDRLDAPQNMLSTQRSNIGLMQGLNGEAIKSESGYLGPSTFMFGADRVLEACPPNTDVSVAATFRSLESNSETLNDPMLNTDDSSYGFLDQISRNLSLTDLTIFSRSSDILENYSRSPFLGPDDESFLDSPDIDHKGDVRGLDTMSEGVNYDNFGSD
ncbi:hypothetical protein K2173_014940 [Erythroxylum novogranatense]|uniref:Angiotensin-converting enzyme 2 n=1 Tax=Erythroxylum novogranatense TaxID=1862640 RepID=A0AAV8TVX0_9ROSI|nr:hypothetical protein K2173_014940 [Erythroxylum novogranatense]